jgi:hypothetical protein
VAENGTFTTLANTVVGCLWGAYWGTIVTGSAIYFCVHCADQKLECCCCCDGDDIEDEEQPDKTDEIEGGEGGQNESDTLTVQLQTQEARLVAQHTAALAKKDKEAVKLKQAKATAVDTLKAEQAATLATKDDEIQKMRGDHEIANRARDQKHQAAVTSKESEAAKLKQDHEVDTKKHKLEIERLEAELEVEKRANRAHANQQHHATPLASNGGDVENLCSVTITDGLEHFRPLGLQGYAVRRHFWLFFRFVSQQRVSYSNTTRNLRRTTKLSRQNRRWRWRRWRRTWIEVFLM